MHQIFCIDENCTAQKIPVCMAADKQFLMEYFTAKKVGQQHAKRNREQQQGLELFDNGKVEQKASYRNHNQRLRIRKQHRYT